MHNDTAILVKQKFRNNKQRGFKESTVNDELQINSSALNRLFSLCNDIFKLASYKILLWFKIVFIMLYINSLNAAYHTSNISTW